ncbi:hypothetical protein TNIN_244761, partial [Trichonephila inaurata madagascariensis]
MGVTPHSGRVKTHCP